MIVSNTADFSGIFIGTVKAYDIEKRRVAVYIPKLMPAISFYDQVLKQTINVTGMKIAVKTQDAITTAPYIWVNLRDADDQMPDVDSKVWVEFIDSLPTKGYCWKFNPYSEGSQYNVIAAEKNIPLFTLNIGGKEIKINKGDTISINVPEGFEAIQPNEKVKEITIKATNTES